MGFDPRYFNISRDGRTATPSGSAAAGAGAGGRVVKRQPEMNKTELAYAQHLDELQRCGRIARYYVKPFNVRLGDNQYYRPDFAAVRHLPDTSIPRLVVVEVKGHLEDDAREKFLHAVSLWPDWDFLMVKKDGRGWAVMMRSQGAEDL